MGIITREVKEVTVVSSDTNIGSEVLCIPPDSTIQPEDDAMLQALYSRSHPGIIENLEKVLSSDSGSFFDKYYVGYAHKSIGDCGSVTVYIENVSMLVAKAIQDCQLYNGQEKSTRYIDFGSVPFFNPFHYDTEYDTEAPGGDEILEMWRKLYMDLFPAVRAHVRRQYPYEENADTERKVYDNATRARAFDICRGLLPAGARTSLSWHSGISTFGDQLPILRSHPLAEVRKVARALDEVLTHVFPGSFKRKDRQHRFEQHYAEQPIEEFYYHDPESPEYQAVARIDRSAFPKPIETALGEPLLPERYKEGGTIEMRFLLDYGSYRDIARHRAVYQRLPILTMDHGMHPWYLENLKAVDNAAERIEEAAAKTAAFLRGTHGIYSEESLHSQYFIPMGYRASCKLTGNLWALGYLVRLRCQSKVHPTLVDLTFRMRDTIAPYVFVHLNEDPFRFNLKRGKDTITKK